MNSPSLGTGRFARLILLAGLCSATYSAAIAESQRFRIHVQEDGVYRVGYEHLQEAGLAGPSPSEQLALENLGNALAVRVEDGGDDVFGPGDSLIFIGRHLRGPTSHYHEYSPFNVYVLSTASRAPASRMSAPSTDRTARDGPAAKLHRTVHLEYDLLRVPLSGPTALFDDETLWYWMQLNHLASEPTRIPIDLSHLDTDASSVFGLKVMFRGWSDNSSSASLGLADHSVQISLNGTPIGGGEWSGRETHLVEMTEIPALLVQPENNTLGIRVPARHPGEDDTPIIDVVYLDWIEATFPRDQRIGDRQQRLELDADNDDTLLSLMQSGSDAAWEQVQFFSEEGFNAMARPKVVDSGSAQGQPVYEISVPKGHHELWVVPEGRFKRPSSIELDHPSNLAGEMDQRDYFIITHGSLVEAIAPLAEFHRERGMRTQIIDVQDVYDEFNFGIEHPRAIRDFLVHARNNRQAPAPSHVLLVGDANWYVKERTEASAGSGRHNQRGLIPTWQIRTRDGPAASDNPYVQLSGDDVHPEMAIGRLPGSTSSEVSAMVEKTIAYMHDPTPDEWRSRVVLVSDRGRNLPARNTLLAERARDAGFLATELLSNDIDDGDRHQSRLRSAIDEGMLVLHFFGHGGRFMWQTSPSRGGDASNLFDMEDLDLLAPSTRLPIILSMSCNTGPFDHPAADSLAEKFVRMADRGAVAVLAASARNSPSLKFTTALFDGILKAGTLGEAVRAAKNQAQHPDAILLYNLFGDPALVPARP